MSERVTRLLGLGVRARNVVIGVAGVRAGLQRGTIACVVLAADASPRTVEKVARLAEAKRIPVVRGPRAEELGVGLGKPPVQAVGVSDPALAKGLTADSEELSGNNADP